MISRWFYAFYASLFFLAEVPLMLAGASSGLMVSLLLTALKPVVDLLQLLVLTITPSAHPFSIRLQNARATFNRPLSLFLTASSELLMQVGTLAQATIIFFHIVAWALIHPLWVTGSLLGLAVGISLSITAFLSDHYIAMFNGGQALILPFMFLSDILFLPLIRLPLQLCVSFGKNIVHQLIPTNADRLATDFSQQVGSRFDTSITRNWHHLFYSYRSAGQEGITYVSDSKSIHSGDGSLLNLNDNVITAVSEYTAPSDVSIAASRPEAQAILTHNQRCSARLYRQNAFFMMPGTYSEKYLRMYSVMRSTVLAKSFSDDLPAAQEQAQEQAQIHLFAGRGYTLGNRR